MINEIQIKNYKSIDDLKISLGRVNVFIGENGAGKSNILEVIALSAAAAAEKLDHEFLSSRGIRVTKPEFMRPAFPDADPTAPITVSLKTNAERSVSFVLNNDNAPYSKWSAMVTGGSIDFELSNFKEAVKNFYSVENDDEKKRRAETVSKFLLDLATSIEESQKDSPKEEYIEQRFKATPADANHKLLEILTKTTIKNSPLGKEISNFVIFSPENSSLRIFEKDGQIEPLGINGEGVLKLLSVYAQEAGQKTLSKVKRSLKVLNWFEDFEPDNATADARLLVTDRFLGNNTSGFDHRSTNEGFFFLLFYFLLFNSELTPKFFAIDNIDASLNPKLCEKLIREIVEAAKTNDKQTILTTHNPAILDGLNLNDDEQRLFVISRSRDGSTKVKRIKKPEAVDGKSAPRLSELFIRGMIGGLPRGF